MAPWANLVQPHWHSATLVLLSDLHLPLVTLQPTIEFFVLALIRLQSRGAVNPTHYMAPFRRVLDADNLKCRAAVFTLPDVSNARPTVRVAPQAIGGHAGK